MVRREETSPKGDGSIRRYFCGEAAAAEKEAAVAAAADDGEAAAEVGADNGAHRLRFGDAGLSSGSKSRVLLRVAPHAIAGAAEVPGSGGVGRGDGRGGQGKGGAETQGEPNRRAQKQKGEPRSAGEESRRRRCCFSGRDSGPGRCGREPEGRCQQLTPAASGASSASSGADPPGEAPAAPAVRSSFAPRLRHSCPEIGSLRKSVSAP